MVDERLTAHGAADLEKFTDMICKLLNIAWGNDWGIFSEENPTGNNPEETPLPHITYNLISRRSTEKRGLKGQTFAPIPDPEHEGETITPVRQWFDCIVEFCIYARTNAEATRLAQRFEEFMYTYRGFFKDEGITEIIFEEERAPEVNSLYRQDIPHRTIRYLVRIERIIEIRSYELRQVGLSLNRVDLHLQAGDMEFDSVFDDSPTPTRVQADLGNEFLDLYHKNFPR